MTAYLQYVVRYDPRSNHHDNLAKEEDEGSNGVDGGYTKSIGGLMRETKYFFVSNSGLEG